MAREDKKESPSSSGEAGNFWTSYSDLLLGLSVIFLVLFFFRTEPSGIERLDAETISGFVFIFGTPFILLADLLLTAFVPNSQQSTRVR